MNSHKQTNFGPRYWGIGFLAIIFGSTPISYLISKNVNPMEGGRAMTFLYSIPLVALATLILLAILYASFKRRRPLHKKITYVLSSYSLIGFIFSLIIWVD